MTIQGTPIVVCIDIIQRYIYEKAGVIVQINPVITPEHEEKFIIALDVACAYFKITL